MWLRQFDDLYGYRGARTEVYYLNAWEFLMLWECMPLPTPKESRGALVPLTLLRPTSEEPDAYVVNPDAETAELLFFPAENLGAAELRKHWYMRRRRRPMVPAPSGTPMPDKQADQEGKARLLSVYMRPWVLDSRIATAEVPHIRDLDVVPCSAPAAALLRRRRLRDKQKAPDALRRSYAESWRWYVRGHVVSHHAQRLIVQFLAASCGKSKRQPGEDADDPESGLRTSKTLPPNALPLLRVREILARMSQAGDPDMVKKDTKHSKKGRTVNAEMEDDEVAEDDAALRQSDQIHDAMRLTAKLWATDAMLEPADAVDLRNSSLGHEKPPAAAGAHSRSRKKKGPRCPDAQQCRAYATLQKVDIDKWRAKISAETEAPTAEQWAVLDRVIERCQVEALELQKIAKGPSYKPKILKEPVRDCLFGIPGAGKSTCLRLIRRFFQECLKWEHGVQFQFLAPQHTMAALVGGTTIHGWSGIPVNATVASNKCNSKATVLSLIHI